MARQSIVAATPFDVTGADTGAVAHDSVHLATRSWNLSEGPPWTGSFEDPEDTYSAHRFGWSLPHLLTAAGAGRCAQLAVAWLASNPCEDGAPGWDSYSVAERLVHWTYLIAVLGRTGAAPAALIAAVAGHARWLSGHLEFRGDATNNHLINDARALYIAGVLLGDEALAAPAREVITFATPRMFVAGFLREGSSHYQRIMCRTYTELLMAGRASGDTPFIEYVSESLDGITSALEFIPGGQAFPLIGDVSPDFLPEYHESAACLARSILGGTPAGPLRGWAGMFRTGQDRLVPRDPPARRSRTVAATAGYYRLERGPWSVFAFVNPSGYVQPWSHAHADVGAFVASWSGRPLLVDSGRATYRATPVGEYGRSIRSHNGVSIDGHEPCVAHGHNGFVPLFRRAYYEPPSPHVDVSEDDGTLRIAHNGFRRIAPALTVVRAVQAGESALIVSDEIQGTGHHLIETFFHFHPSVRVTMAPGPMIRAEVPDRVTFLIECPATTEVAHVRGRVESNPAGWYSSRYGSLEPCSTLIFAVRAELPHHQRFIVRAV